MDTQRFTLSPDEERANECLNRYGSRVDRSSGVLVVRGDFDRLQAAYLDPPCRALIAPGVAEEIRLFFEETIDREVNAGLRARGYDTSDVSEYIHSDEVPSEVISECTAEALNPYRTL